MAKIDFTADLQTHPLHYFSLVCTLGIGLWGMYWFGYNKAIQLSLIVSLAISYVVWGIIHHALHRDLHIKIVVEYALIAVLAILIIGSLMYQA